MANKNHLKRLFTITGFDNDKVKQLSKEFWNNSLTANRYISGIDINNSNITAPNTVTENSCGDCHGCECSFILPEFKDDHSILYKFNNESYRCDDFSIEDASKNYLFSGCSHTFASGLNVEDSWTYLLNKHLNGEKFFSLAISGASHKIIIDDIIKYIKKYGKPKAVFVLFPNVERIQVFGEKYGKLITTVNHYMFNKNKEHADNIFPEEVALNYFISDLLIFESYLESIGVPFKWSTWDISLDSALKFINEANGIFNGYIPLYASDNAHELYSYVNQNYDNSHKFWITARNAHPGIMEQIMCFELFKNNLDGIV